MKYNFLFKPLFFICSLLFASWLVLYIEKISPSDFGKHESLFNSSSEPTYKEPISPDARQAILEKICRDYKAGLTDSIKLDEQLKEFLKSEEKYNQK